MFLNDDSSQHFVKCKIVGANSINKFLGIFLAAILIAGAVNLSGTNLAFADHGKVGSVVEVSAQDPSSIQPGDSATFIVTVNRTAGESGAINADMSITTALPTGVSASFNPETVTLLPTESSDTTTLTLTTTGSTPDGSTIFTVKAQRTPADFHIGDGTLNVDGDTDGDGVLNSADNCPDVVNADQTDVDADGIGDACDPLIDSDGDGVGDDVDACPGFDDAIDVDLDGIPDGCDGLIDSDGDGVGDDIDACLGFDDAIDTDSDGIPDGCDADVPGDTSELMLNADALNQNIINLVWDDVAQEGCDVQYDIYRKLSTDSSFGDPLTTVFPPPPFNYPDTGLTGNTSYDYQVIAVFSGEGCEASDIESDPVTEMTLSFQNNGGSSGDTTPPTTNGISFFSVRGGTQTEGFGGRLVSYSTNIPTQIMHTGVEQRLQVSVSDNSGIASIKQVVVNFFFDYNLIQKSDTYFMYDEDTQELTVSDPLGIFGDVKVHRTYTETEMVLTFTFTPQKPLDVTDIVINARDEYLNNINTIIFAAFKIVGEILASLEEETVEAEIPYYKNPEWNQFVIDSDGNMMTYDAFGNLDTKPMRVIASPVYYGDDIGKSERHDDGFNDKIASEKARVQELADALNSKTFYEPEKTFKVDKVFKYPKNIGKADRSDIKSMNDLKQKEHSKAMQLAKRMS